VSQLQDIISGIELDAAWDRIKVLENERNQAILSFKTLQARNDKLSMSRSRMVAGIGNILAKVRPDTPEMSAVLDELIRLRDSAYDE
jgi:hypothetical protein